MKIEWKTTDLPIEYPDALKIMEERVNLIQKKQAPELIWFLEHPAIYTAGTSAIEEDLLNKEQFPVYQTGRGGQYTYHGPGQRIIYLMLDLKRRGADVKKYVASLEDWIIASLAEIGIKAKKKEGKIGIWVGNKKIAAIGIRISKWVSYHGIAINLNPDINHYNGIIPCGIKEFGITSLHELGHKISYQDLDNILKSKFYEIF
jgi:lipoyl(octanoyl) transferase